MSLLKTIQHIRPDLALDRDFEVVRGKLVPLSDATMPTQAEIDAGELGAKKHSAKRAINAEAKRRIALLSDPENTERNLRRACRINNERAKLAGAVLTAEPYVTWEAQMLALDNAIEAIVTDSNTATAAMEKLTTVEAVEAFDTKDW
jgi:hypothetical protein